MDAESDPAHGQDAPPRPAGPSVVIVGGGIAGVSAARHFINSGIQRVLILEAKNRMGGRIHTVTGDSGTMDLGAQYIHGQDGNPIYQVALQHDLILPPSKSQKVRETNNLATSELYGNEFRTNDGELVPMETILDVNEFLEEVSEECNGCHDDTCRNESMGNRFETRFEEYLQSRDDSESDVIAKRGVFDWRMRWELQDNGCRSLFDAALARYQNYSGNYFMEVRGGFYSIFQALLDEIPHECLRIDTPVSKINWKSNDENSHRSSTCTVETKYGENVKCDYVIVTVSLGVLQANVNTLFHPSLPQSRKDAISRSGFGNIVKVFLTWTESFWDNSFEGIQFVWTSPIEKTNYMLPKNTATKKNGDPWYRDFDGFHVLEDSPRTLLGWLGGEGANLSESLSEEEILSTCHRLLQVFAPHKDIPKPQGIRRTQWLNDEYTRGTYSFVSMYSNQGDTEEMATPLPSEEEPALLFAGEALSFNHYSTTHGAYETGIQAANTILQNERKKYRK